MSNSTDTNPFNWRKPTRQSLVHAKGFHLTFNKDDIKVTDKLPPMGILLPVVVDKLLSLEVGQGIDTPQVSGLPNKWSGEINEFAKRHDLKLQVKQMTRGGVTTVWRIKCAM